MCSQKIFALPPDFKVCYCDGYKNGKILGIDLSSVFAIEALRLSAGDKVLDLCCAPGAKLATLADTVGKTGRVIGVDIVPHRLDVARCVMKKYGFRNVGLILGDGRHHFFNDKNALYEMTGGAWNNWSLPYMRERKKRLRRRRCFNSTKISDEAFLFFNVLCEAKETTELFDKVLVDVECTHDGSLRHVEKFIRREGKKKYDERVTDPIDLQRLRTLQTELLASGICHAKKGGLIVYSTCSLMSSQNEEIVRDILQQFKDTVSEMALPFLISNQDSEPHIPAVPIRISETEELPISFSACLFDPETSGTSGLFISCLQKKQSLFC